MPKIITENPAPSRYMRHNKEKAVNVAFSEGFRIGLLALGRQMDYGFGPNGLGGYIYTNEGKILAFVPDY